jgi:hypothetical protein
MVFVNAGVTIDKTSDNVPSEAVVNNDVHYQFAENPVQAIILLEPDDGLISVFLDNSPTRGSPLYI